MSAAATQAHGSGLRAALRWIHRWIALTLGTVFLVVAVSGSLLLFQPQFFSWAHGELLPAGLGERIGSIDRWVTNARTAVPGLRGLVAIWMPRAEHNESDAGMLVFSGREPGGFGNTGLVAVLIEPGAGDVLGVIDIDRSPAYAPIFMHQNLWLADAGRTIVAVMAAGMLVMLAIGFYLWWPARGDLARKLSARPWRATLGNARRLHDWLGVWMLSLLLVLAATGLYLLRPDWIEPALESLPGSQAAQDHPAGAQTCAGPIGFDTAIARARALVPAGALVKVVPEDFDRPNPWEIIFRPSGSTAGFQETHVLADLECGRVVLEATPATRSARDATELWLVSLHDGTAFGSTGKIVVALGGLAPLLMLWSGVRMWCRRRGWLHSRKIRAAPET